MVPVGAVSCSRFSNPATMSNMRSKRWSPEGQPALWEQAPGPDEVPQVRSGESARSLRPRARAVAVADGAAGWRRGEATWVLRDDAFAARGWPSGTVLHLAAASRAARGELVVVEDRGRTALGYLGADRGRPALLTDRGTTWLSDSARVVAAVTAVEASLLVDDLR